MSKMTQSNISLIHDTSSDSFGISPDSDGPNFNNSSVKLKTNSPETQKLTESQGHFRFGKKQQSINSRKANQAKEDFLSKTVRDTAFKDKLEDLKTSITRSQISKSTNALDKEQDKFQSLYDSQHSTGDWGNLSAPDKMEFVEQTMIAAEKTSKQESAATSIRDEGNITSALESGGLGRPLTGEYAVFARVVERMVPANDLSRDNNNDIAGIRYHGAIISLQDGKGFTAFGPKGSGLKPDDLRNITKQFLTEFDNTKNRLIASASNSNNTGVGASAVSATANVDSSTAPDGSDTVDQAFANELKKMEINPDEGSLRYDGKKIGTFPVPLKDGQVAKTYKYDGNRLIPGDTNSNRQEIVKRSWTINTGGLRDWAKGKVDSKTAENLVYHSLAFENNEGLRTSLKDLNISKPALLVNLMAANSSALNNPQTANEIIDLYGLVSGQNYESSSDERDALVSFITSTTSDDIGNNDNINDDDEDSEITNDDNEIDDEDSEITNDDEDSVSNEDEYSEITNDDEDSSTDLNDDPDNPNQGAGGNKPAPKPAQTPTNNTITDPSKNPPKPNPNISPNSPQGSESHKSDTNGRSIGGNTPPPSDIKGQRVRGSTDSDSGSASGIGKKKNKNKANTKNQDLSDLSDDIFESDDGGQDDKKVKNRKLNNKQPKPEEKPVEHKEISGPGSHPSPLPPQSQHPKNGSKPETDDVSVKHIEAEKRPEQTNKTKNTSAVEDVKLPPRMEGYDIQILHGMKAFEFLGELGANPFTESCDFTITGGKFKTQEKLNQDGIKIQNVDDGKDFNTELAGKDVNNVKALSCFLDASGLGKNDKSKLGERTIFSGSAAHNYKVNVGGQKNTHNGIDPDYFSELPTLTYVEAGKQGGKHKDYENDIAKGAVWSFDMQQWIAPNSNENYIGVFHKKKDRDAFEIVYLDLNSFEDLDQQTGKSNDDDSIKPTKTQPDKRKRTPKGGNKVKPNEDSVNINKTSEVSAINNGSYTEQPPDPVFYPNGDRALTPNRYNVRSKNYSRPVYSTTEGVYYCAGTGLDKDGNDNRGFLYKYNSQKNQWEDTGKRNYVISHDDKNDDENAMKIEQTNAFKIDTKQSKPNSWPFDIEPSNTAPNTFSDLELKFIDKDIRNARDFKEIHRIQNSFRDRHPAKNPKVFLQHMYGPKTFNKELNAWTCKMYPKGHHSASSDRCLFKYTQAEGKQEGKWELVLQEPGKTIKYEKIGKTSINQGNDDYAKGLRSTIRTALRNATLFNPISGPTNEELMTKDNYEKIGINVERVDREQTESEKTHLSIFINQPGKDGKCFCAYKNNPNSSRYDIEYREPQEGDLPINLAPGDDSTNKEFDYFGKVMLGYHFDQGSGRFIKTNA